MSLSLNCNGELREKENYDTRDTTSLLLRYKQRLAGSSRCKILIVRMVSVCPSDDPDNGRIIGGGGIGLSLAQNFPFFPGIRNARFRITEGPLDYSLPFMSHCIIWLFLAKITMKLVFHCNLDIFQPTLYACNIPRAVCAAPPEDDQVMLETCRGP
jgi:hypothetical protein